MPAPTPDRNFASTTEHAAAVRIADDPPFSFVYGGRPFPEGFVRTGDHAFLHPATGLRVTLEVSLYGEDSSAVEWTPRFENTGAADTPVIEDIRALDWRGPMAEGAWIGTLNGTQGRPDDFLYREAPLAEATYASLGSRSLTPFFNVACGADSGFVLALGWTGVWSVSCAPASDGTVRVAAGMRKTHFILHPGEKVRQPRVLMLFWEGDRLRAQNMCRRHLVLHHVPADENGEPFPPVCVPAWGGMKAANHLAYIRFIEENGLRFDYYWIDAGWHGPDHETEEYQNFLTEDWAYNTGDWTENRRVYPNGLKEVADAARAAGMKPLLWFHAYVGNEGVGWMKDHPEWSGPLGEPHGIGLCKRPTRVGRINVAIPEARKWLADTIGGTLVRNGMAGYREDTCLPYAGEDAPDREGVAEIRAVEALYEIWDGYRARIPGLLIDNCGGGGSRVDLETLSRSYVLWRSDFNCPPDADPLGSQVGNWGLGHFIPLVGGGAPVRPGGTYGFRSSIYGGMPFGLFHNTGYGEGRTAPAPGYPVEWHRRMLDAWRRVRPLLCGDFFPLTGCDTATDGAVAYAFWRADLGRGALLAFFRQDCPKDELPLALPLPAGRYRFTDDDTGEERIVPAGPDGAPFRVAAVEKPFAALWHFAVAAD